MTVSTVDFDILRTNQTEPVSIQVRDSGDNLMSHPSRR